MAEKTIKEIASKGGLARAKSLSKQQLSDIGRKAVEERWAKKGKKPLPKATHEGPLPILNVELDCAVLEGGIRVFSQRAMTRALGGKRGGSHWRRMKQEAEFDGAQLPVFISANNLKEFIDSDLRAALSSPIKYQPLHGGGTAFGIKAELVPDICKVFRKAMENGALHESQKQIAIMAGLLHDSFAKVGVIALVDEATGFQYERPRKDLEEYLKKFLSESLVKWARSFPNDYFKHLCRLKGVELRADMRLPQYFGHLTNDLVYRRIAPGLLHALKERRSERGTPSQKLHWWTSAELGHPELLLHLGTVVGLMKIHTDYEAFRKQLDTIAEIRPEAPGLFDDPKDWEKPD